MNLTITIPDKWNPGCSKTFHHWHTNTMQGKHLVKEDYNILNNE